MRPFVVLERVGRLPSHLDAFDILPQQVVDQAGEVHALHSTLDLGQPKTGGQAAQHGVEGSDRLGAAIVWPRLRKVLPVTRTLTCSVPASPA